jgi:hypothetical protein
MPADYLPMGDEPLMVWSENASAQITSDPMSFGLSAPIATVLAGLVLTYKNAVLAAKNPATRGSSTCFAMSEAKQALIAYVRPMVRTIQGTLSVTAQQKHDLGINVRKAPSPISAPVDAPATEVEEMNGWLAKFKCRPAGSEGRSTMADGAAQLQIYSYIGTTPPGNVNDWHFEGVSSRANFSVAFDPDLAVGSKVYVCCCWATARGLTSPACAAIGLLIGGGVPEVGAA